MAKNKQPIPTTEQFKEPTVPSPYAKDFFKSLIEQVGTEWEVGYRHQNPRIQQNLARLKLYNNQRKDASAVGDTTLFTVMQTILASFYEDELTVNFVGREDGDDEIAEMITAMAKHDHKKMGKDEIDYFWLWDTLFYGRGLVYINEYDRKEMIPKPELFDPSTFLRDPKASSVNGNNGRGGMRFGGREIEFGKHELTKETGYFDFDDLKGQSEVKSLINQAQQERDSAQGHNTEQFNKSDEDLGDNQLYPGTQWFTHWKAPNSDKVKKVMVILANNRSKVIKYVEFDKRFPIVDRPLYPTSKSWDGTSIPDLVEDKQRQKSVALNLVMQGMKADLYPMYLYDEDRIKNKGDLLKFAFNKFVGVKGGGDIRGAVNPMNKSTPKMDLANWVLNTLDASAQIATATPDMQQGQISDQQRTLGELNLVASKVDTRYSLTAKVFSWSEEDFWRFWYLLHKEHFTDGVDEKIIRIVGASGTRFRTILKEDIIAFVDPDIEVESKQVSEAKNLRERILLQGYFKLLIESGQKTNMMFSLRKLGKLNGFTTDEVEAILPPTPEELVAEEENEKLSENQLVQVSTKDDHQTHYYVHAKAADTPAKIAHMKAHRVAMKIVRQQPELGTPEDQMPPQQANGQQVGARNNPAGNPLTVTPSRATQPNVGVETR